MASNAIRACRECGAPGLMWTARLMDGERRTVLVDAGTNEPHLCPKTGKVPMVFGAGRWAKRRPFIPAGEMPRTATERTEQAAPAIIETIATVVEDQPAMKQNGHAYEQWAVGAVEQAILGLIGPSVERRIKELEQTVTALMAEAEGKTGTKVVEHTVTVRNAAGDETHCVTGAHAQFADLLMLVQPIPVLGRIPVLLYGKPGASKSHSGKMLAEALGLSFWSISLTPQTPESRLFGLVPIPGQEYRETGFQRAVTNGGIVLVDELDFGPPSLLGSLNSLLANGFASFPNSPEPVKVHPDFVLIATANTPGRGGAVGHESRRPLDAATLDRFAVMEWRYDQDQEQTIATAINSEAAGWTRWIQDVRAYAAETHPGLTVSPRSSYYGAGLLAAGFAPERVADMVLFRGLDKASVAKIVAACPVPKVRA